MKRLNCERMLNDVYIYIRYIIVSQLRSLIALVNSRGFKIEWPLNRYRCNRISVIQSTCPLLR